MSWTRKLALAVAILSTYMQLGTRHTLWLDSKALTVHLKSLFMSAEHADVRIICGHREFSVHRAILAGRSGWFKQRFEELSQVRFTKAHKPPNAYFLMQLPQEPGQIPVITIALNEPHEMEMVLIFIYAGGSSSRPPPPVPPILFPFSTPVTLTFRLLNRDRPQEPS